jgi:putative tricarboxylic transport membrane protein
MTAAARDWPGAAVALGFAALGAQAVSGSLSMTPLGAIFPRTIGIVLAGLALVQAVRCLAGRGGASTLEEGARGGSIWRRAALAAVMLVWVVAFPVVGFLVTSLIAGAVLTVIAEFETLTPQRLALRLAMVAAMVAIFYWLMVSVLYIPMPRTWLI